MKTIIKFAAFIFANECNHVRERISQERTRQEHAQMRSEWLKLVAEQKRLQAV